MRAYRCGQINRGSVAVGRKVGGGVVVKEPGGFEPKASMLCGERRTAKRWRARDGPGQFGYRDVNVDTKSR